jgi:hypothetical protein
MTRYFMGLPVIGHVFPPISSIQRKHSVVPAEAKAQERSSNFRLPLE